MVQLDKKLTIKAQPKQNCRFRYESEFNNCETKGGRLITCENNLSKYRYPTIKVKKASSSVVVKESVEEELRSPAKFPSS